MPPELVGPVSLILSAIATAILMASAYYFPRGHHRPGAVKDEEEEKHDG